MAVQSSPAWQAQRVSPAADEKSALGKVVWFGIVWVVGVVAGWVVGFFIFWTAFSSSTFYNLPPNPSPSEVSAAMGPFFQYGALIVPLTLAVELAGMVLLTLAFRQMRKVDPGEFSLPSSMMLVLILGMLVAGSAVVPLFYNLPDIIAQAPYSSGSTPSAAFVSAIGSIIVYGLVAGVGGLMALIGVIGGVLLGVWRLGSRYNETLFKVGAILVIIPLLNILAPVLILLAASQVRGRLGRGV